MTGSVGPASDPFWMGPNSCRNPSGESRPRILQPARVHSFPVLANVPSEDFSLPLFCGFAWSIRGTLSSVRLQTGHLRILRFDLRPTLDRPELLALFRAAIPRANR